MLLAVIIAGCCLALVALLIVVLLPLSRLRFPVTKPGKTATGPPRWLEWLLVGLFGVVWSAATIFFDVMAVGNTVQQYRALDYLPVEGEVVKCAKVEESSDDGTSYDIDIEYVYSVADQEYRGTRVRYDKLWGGRWVSQFVKAHPPQTQITVYYDSADPAEAVLIREMGGGPLWMAMFAVPFNVAMLGCFAFFIIAFRHRKWPADLLPYVVIERGAARHIRLAPHSAAIAGLGCLFLTAFLVIPIGLCCRMPPSVEVMAIAWVIVLGLPIWICFDAACRNAAGEYDVVLDSRGETLALPRRLVGSDVVVPFSAVVSVDVVAVPDKENGMQYAPTVRWRAEDGELRESRLATWSSEEHAEQLVALLRSEVRLPARSAENTENGKPHIHNYQPGVG
jgi:hypothetical protein